MLPAGAPRAQNPGEELLAYYSDLLRRLGPQRWWPARTRLEVILGAILTQNTSWRNAALAIRGLRRAGLLNLRKLRRAREPEIAAAVRSAGFFRQKAAAIRAFLDWLDRAHGGSLARCFAAPHAELREQLLNLRGLGPETVDCILLYAGRRPFFVADAYARRVLARHGWLEENAGYREGQELFHRHLPRDPALFNEFHALLVETGKRWCRKRAPDCAACPLGPYLERREVTRVAWPQPVAESHPA
jgi:endonuclease-3 related protein